MLICTRIDGSAKESSVRIIKDHMNSGHRSDTNQSCDLGEIPYIFSLSDTSFLHLKAKQLILPVSYYTFLAYSKLPENILRNQIES